MAGIAIRWRISAVLACALSVSTQSHAQAQPDPAASEYRSCSAAAAGISALTMCGQKYVATVEAELSEVFKEVAAAQSDAVQRQLSDEQARWEDYLAGSCQYFANAEEFGREGVAVQFPLCRVRIVQQRAEQLRNLFKRAEPAAEARRPVE